MLATRGGLPLGGVLTGLSIEFFGVRHALLINGSLAIIAHLVIGRIWARSPLPKEGVAITALNHHNKIFAAISKRNATAARNSMHAHLEAMASVLLEQDPSPEMVEARGNANSGYNT